MNKVILIGNLTKNPETGATDNGNKYAKFTVAINRGHGRDEVDYINIVAWNALAENCGKYLAKGKKVGVVGSLQIRSYDTMDGTRRYVTEVCASEVEFLSAATNNTNAPENAPAQSTGYDEDDDLPF